MHKQMNHLGTARPCPGAFTENVLYFGLTFPVFAGEYHIHFDLKNPFRFARSVKLRDGPLIKLRTTYSSY